MNLLSDNSTFIPSNILIEHPLCPGSTQPDSYTPTSSKMILARINQLAIPLPQIIPQSSLFFQNFLNHLIQDVGVPFRSPFSLSPYPVSCQVLPILPALSILLSCHDVLG